MSKDYRRSRPAPSTDDPTTDVKLWMRTSGPRDLEEVAQLRKGMNANVAGQLFRREIRIVGASVEKELWCIKGHTSTLIIASQSHLKFFRGAVRRRKKHIETWGPIVPPPPPAEPKPPPSLFR